MPLLSCFLENKTVQKKVGAQLQLSSVSMEQQSYNGYRQGMGLLEYQVMPSLRDIAKGGRLCTFTI